VKLRGTIIKVPDSTPGLLFADGQQRPFLIDGIWRSPVAPAANMVVEMDLDGAGAVTSIMVVDSQQLAREKFSQFSGVAQAAEIARVGVGALAGSMGKAPLIATVALWSAWFFLPAVSISIFLGSKSFTLWELLGADLTNAMRLGTGGNRGLFGILGIVAIAAPFAAPFLKHPRARLLNALPLAFLFLAIGRVWWAIRQAIGSAGGGEMGQFAKEMAEKAIESMLEALSIGAGTYVVVIASVFLAVQAFRSPRNI
jgi:hypothetical protein